MNVIAGCIIQKGNKILMVKEAKKECYGQWCYPAGKVDQFEKITDAAIREVFEETGCKIELKGVLPIITVDLENRSIVVIRFIANIVEENINFNQEEILDVQWIEIDKIKNMTEKELRGYEANKKVLEDIEQNRIYPLELFDNTKYNR